ncbi:MAG: hypothetical protein P1V97_08060, partial [Planctomycetota bacterium]|nr:hypothetical protein [Planctomycetota bacterium]
MSENREEVREDLLKIARTPSILMNDPSPEGDTLTRFFRLAENEESTMDTTIRSVLLYIKEHVQILFFAEVDSTEVVANFFERHTKGAFDDLQTESLYLGAQPWNKEDPFSMPVGYRKKTPTGRLMPTSTVWKQDEDQSSEDTSQLESLDESAEMADFERSVDELGILSSDRKSSESLGYSGDELGILSSRDGAFDSNDATAIVEVTVLEPPSTLPGEEQRLQLIASRPLESEDCLTPPQTEAPTGLDPAPGQTKGTPSNDSSVAINELLNPQPASVTHEPSPQNTETSLSDSQKKISSIRKRKSQRLQQAKIQAQESPLSNPAPAKSSTLRICLALILGFGLGLIPYLVVLKQTMDKEKVGLSTQEKDHSSPLVALITQWDKEVQKWNEQREWTDNSASLDDYEKKHKELSDQLKAHEKTVDKNFYGLAQIALQRMSKQIATAKILREMHQALKACPPQEKSPLKVQEAPTGFVLSQTLPCHTLLAKAEETLAGHS